MIALLNVACCLAGEPNQLRNLTPQLDCVLSVQAVFQRVLVSFLRA